MKTSWLKGLSDERKKEVKDEFLSSPTIRSRLVTILGEKIESSRTGLRTKEGYDKPSWGYQQADGIGYERALYEVISLIEDKSVDKE